MLSQEASNLTRLILMRHNLACRVVELDVELEVLALLQSVPDPALAERARVDADKCLSRRADAASAEASRLPVLLARVDSRIRAAWARLHRTSPCPRS